MSESNKAGIEDRADSDRNTVDTPNGLIDQELVTFSVEAAIKAGRIALNWFQSRGLAVTTKRDGSPVTEADYVVERFLRSEIIAAFPGDAILGEEEGTIGAVAGEADRCWVIDPIDGTKAFTQGVPLFATLLALVDDLGPALGVICLPALNECVWAARGDGTYWSRDISRVSDTAEACGVSSRNSLTGAYVCTSGLSYWPERSLERVRASGARVRTWGDAYGYALVATGRADAMIDPECRDWDIAPMSVVIAEAGGRFTDTSGVADWRNGSGLASNQILHDQLLQCFRP